jgi:hypothetical protein
MDNTFNEQIFNIFGQLMPKDIINISIDEIKKCLINQFNDDFFVALDHNQQIKSPLINKENTDWIKQANCVGINVRTIGSFWKIIPYALTLPKTQDSVHILPIWEPGVVASLYGPASWNINREFFSYEMQQEFPHLDTVEKQLKVVINLLHLMGKSVGMDVVPHTDRFSEQVLANPQHFEWLIRQDLKIIDHSNNLHHKAQDFILEFLQYRGTAVTGLNYPKDRDAFFGKNYPESERLRILFGEKADYEGRLQKRNEFVQLFYEMGLETVPATMAPPYRGLEVDPHPDAKTIDEERRVWRDYKIINPQKMSRVFGPLTRFKLYESLDDNQNWVIDFNNPRIDTWAYVCEHYSAIQEEFGFDFMRGDMSHVQMQPQGVPSFEKANLPYYDLLGAVKAYILPQKPYFGYFAESFLAPDGEMAFGNEIAHLETSLADSTLGDIQSEPVGTPVFKGIFKRYLDILAQHSVAPNLTMMTADKDDPRFDSYYVDGNEWRYFTALFLHNMPSYMGLGFECRDVHTSPAPNEHYTKLYVFHLEHGPKSTKGPYIWGKNRKLYQNLKQIGQQADRILPLLKGKEVHWILQNEHCLVWTQKADATHIFIANWSEITEKSIEIPLIKQENWKILFSSLTESRAKSSVKDEQIILEGLQPFECITLELTNITD